MISVKFFPTLMIALSLGASVAYAIKGFDNWRMIVYWIAAATLTAVVTY